jgi:hypothetical protein
MGEYPFDQIRRIIRDVQKQNAGKMARHLQGFRATVVVPQLEHIVSLQRSAITQEVARSLTNFQKSVLQREVRRSIENLQRAVLPGVQSTLSELQSERFRPIFENLAEVARRTRERVFPANWEGFTYDDVRSTVAVMEETGWSLVWVPRRETVRALVEADPATREAVLLGAADDIVEDLEAALMDIEDSNLGELRELLAEAVASYRVGHHAAAQALATTIFTTILHVHLGHKRFKSAQEEFAKRDPMQATIVAFKIVAIYRAAIRAIETYFGDESEPIPTTFNRHATTHRVSKVQYTTTNALAALLLATSLIRELDLLSRLGLLDVEDDEAE